MKIYFVRHGESEDDLADIHQQQDSPLSDLGRHQAVAVSHFFQSVPFDVLLTSPLLRARQTAEQIAKHTDVDLEEEELLAEVRRPSELLGNKRTDPAFDSLRKLLKEKWTYPAWHYSDEENFHEVKRRAKELLRVLSSRKEQTIVAVTHGHFLTMVFLVMVFGKEVNPYEYEMFDQFAHMDNAAVTMCELLESKKWKMRMWNEQQHLASLGDDLTLT